jgi:repeat uncharacterized protein DUF347
MLGLYIKIYSSKLAGTTGQSWLRKERCMTAEAEHSLSKVPEVTLIFWIIKIAATTLGETGGDAVSMSMGLGYFVGTIVFAAVFLVAVGTQMILPTDPLASATPGDRPSCLSC